MFKRLKRRLAPIALGDGPPPVPLFSIDLAGGELELQLRTADRRQWRAVVRFEDLARLADLPLSGERTIESAASQHLSTLEFAALRAISRGATAASRVFVDKRDLGIGRRPVTLDPLPPSP